MSYRVITGTLKARTAVHVGSGEGNELADSLLRRDTEGRVLIPGTAIAGALRSLLTRMAPRLGGGVCVAMLPKNEKEAREKQGCDCRVCRLFGDVEPSDETPAAGEEERAHESAASRLLVFNAELVDDGDAATLVRDGVGIERATGAAARATGAKFDLETLPAGAEFALRLELREDDPGERVEDEHLLAVALAEWQEGRAHLGGDVARGLGAFDLEDVAYRERDLEDAEGLMAFLRSDAPWEQATKRKGWLQGQLDAATADIKKLEKARQRARKKHGLDRDQARQLPITTGWAEWTFTLQAEGPFLTNDAMASGLSGFDHAPLLQAVGDWTRPVLPGSSLRGVLRSHAERIARTLVTHRALKASDAQGYFLGHCPACDPLKFGEGDAALESCDSLLRHQKHVSENDEVAPGQLCLACRLFGSTRRGSRLIVEDAPYVNADGDNPTYKMLDFLAVDRFTGGGAEGLKFDALALWRPAFKARIFLENPEPWELGWLTLALRDLAEGWLRVGFGAAKGFGKVTVAEGTLRRGRLDAERATSGQESVFVVDELAFDDPALEERQRRWVKAFNEQVAAFEREDGLELPADSYFGAVDQIYGEEGR
jgi:CRISPR/Cas system CSM-associated protein Csm3 (group 7 of RAMP superfamily)